MNLCEQKHTSQVHLLKLRNIIAVLKKRLSVIVLSCKPVTSKNVIFVDQTQPASQPACHPELYRLQCSTLHKCNVDAKKRRLGKGKTSWINKNRLTGK